MGPGGLTFKNYMKKMFLFTVSTRSPETWSGSTQVKN